MENSIVGVLGVASFEILITLSLFHRSLNESVLLIDVSKEQSLASCIPMPTGMYLHDMIEWNGIKVTSSMLDSNVITGYSRVYIYFGMYSNWLYEDLCNEYLVITDSWNYNISNMKHYKYIKKRISNILLKKNELDRGQEGKIRYELELDNQVPMYCMEESSFYRYGKEIEVGYLPRRLYIPTDVLEYIVLILIRFYPSIKDKDIRIILKHMYMKKYYVYGAVPLLKKKGYNV